MAGGKIYEEKEPKRENKLDQPSAAVLFRELDQ